MDQVLESRLELFNSNNRAMLRRYWFNWNSLAIMGSLFFTNQNREADIQKIDECRRLLKRKVGLFSNLRGNLVLPIAVNMALAPDAEAYLDGVLEAYKRLQKGKIFRTEFEVLAAIVLHENRDKIKLDAAAEDVWRVYRRMREEHPLLTGREDMATATLISVSDKSDEQIIREMEMCYDRLKPHFALRGEMVQTLSALLAVLDGEPYDKCERAMAIVREMKRRHISLSFSYGLPLIAGLVALDEPVEPLIDRVCEAADWLKHKRGFSIFGQGKQGRITYGMLLCINDSISGKMMDTSLQSTLASVILVEIMITMMIIAASRRNSQSNNNSNSN